MSKEDIEAAIDPTTPIKQIKLIPFFKSLLALIFCKSVFLNLSLLLKSFTTSANFCFSFLSRFSISEIFSKLNALSSLLFLI